MTFNPHPFGWAHCQDCGARYSPEALAVPPHGTWCPCTSCAAEKLKRLSPVCPECLAKPTVCLECHQPFPRELVVIITAAVFANLCRTCRTVTEVHDVILRTAGAGDDVAGGALPPDLTQQVTPS